MFHAKSTSIFILDSRGYENWIAEKCELNYIDFDLFSIILLITQNIKNILK